MGMPATEFKRPESVLVVVYTQKGEVLMMERSKPKGFWQSVTGSLEWNELPLSAARRELREETGLLPGRVRSLRVSTSFRIRSPWRERYAPGSYKNLEHWFCLELPDRRGISLDNSEHRQYRWLPWRDACRVASSFTNRNCIQKIFGA